MRENSTKVFIPAAALVCFGVENSSGALPCDETLQKNNMCDPYTLNFIEAKGEQKKEDFSKKESESLYNRVASKKNQVQTVQTQELQEPQETIVATQTPKEPAKVSKKIVKNAKEVTLPKIQSSEKVATKEKKNVQSYTYVVNKGDTLSKIAKEFNIPIATLSELNNLENKTLVAGQKLKIPQNAKKKLYTKSFYRVSEGDTLESIAKRFNTTVSKLMKYNALNDHTIKVGQKIYLKANKIAKAHKASKVKKVIKLAKTKKAGGLKKLRVTATAYTSHRGQTDKTPFLAAWNNRIRPGMKIIAVSRDLIKKYGLTNGKKVRIQGLPGVYTVKDKMNKRYKKRIDIYMGVNKRKALKWGKKKLVIMF